MPSKTSYLVLTKQQAFPFQLFSILLQFVVSILDQIEMRRIKVYSFFIFSNLGAHYIQMFVDIKSQKICKQKNSRITRVPFSLAQIWHSHTE